MFIRRFAILRLADGYIFETCLGLAPDGERFQDRKTAGIQAGRSNCCWRGAGQREDCSSRDCKHTQADVALAEHEGDY